MSNPLVSIVIVSYNNQRVIFDCLESLKINSQIREYVVDNISCDAFLQELATKYPSVILHHNIENVGFSRANNLALRLVETKYALILNSDTSVPRETIPAMVTYMEKHKEVGMVGCRVELMDGTLDKACRRSFPTPWVALSHYSFLDRLFPRSPFFSRYNVTYLPEEQTFEVDALVGAFMLVRKEAMDEVGLFDEDYFMYGEDIDWCYRFKKFGWKIVYHPVQKIVHHKGASSGLKKHSSTMSLDALHSRKRTLAAFYSSMSIFYRKHYTHSYPLLVHCLVIGGIRIKYVQSLLFLYGRYYSKNVNLSVRNFIRPILTR